MSKYFSGVKGSNFTLNSTTGLSNSTGLATSYAATGVYTGISGSTNAGIELVAASGSALSFIDFSYINVDFRGRIMYNHTANSMAFSTNVATAMTLNSAGDMTVVGQVNGREGLNASFYSGLVDAASYNMLMRGANDTGDKFVMFLNGSTRSGEGDGNAATIRNEGGSIRLGSSSYLTTLEGNDITLTSDTYLFGGSINLMNGHVGIGTSSPQSALHITGRIHTAGSDKGVHGGMVIATDATLSLVSDTSANKSDILFGYTGNRNRGFISYDHPGNTMNFHTNGSFVAKVSINSVGTLTSAIDTDTSFYAPNCQFPSYYNMVLRGGNDTGDKLVVFVNGSNRNFDGANNAAIIRNEGGELELGVESQITRILGSMVYTQRLDVDSNTFTSPNVDSRYDDLTVDTDTGTKPVCARFNNWVFADPGYYTASDKRIKYNVKDIIETQLSKLRPVTYNFKDVKRGHGMQYGLIAQEVEEVYPDAILRNECFIPNIMIRATPLTKNTFELVIPADIDVDIDTELRTYVKLIDKPEKRVDCKITNIDGNIYTVDIEFDEIFIYGTKVPDFRAIKYDSFIPLLIKDSQQKTEKINKLESELNELKILVRSLM